MINLIKIFKSLIQILLNLLFVIQISLMVLTFLTAAYWFFDLIGSDIFNFAEPIVNVVKDFVRLFYNQDVLIGGVYIDGSLLLFDFLAVLFVLMITKSKYYVHCLMDYADGLIQKLRQIEEDNFNKNLKAEVDAKIRKMNNFAVLIELEIKDMLVQKPYKTDVEVRDLKPKIDYAYKILYSTLKNIKNCKLAKKEKKLVVLCDDFSKIDNVIYFIEQAISRIMKNLQNEKLLLISYIATDVFENDVDFKERIYPALEQLVKLQNKDMVTCFGNFNLRYSLKTEPMYYTMLLKGAYMIDGGADIYVMLKRN